MYLLKIVPFTLLITTGFYKAAVKNLPIDITLLTALITLLSVIFVFIKSSFKINKAIFIVILLFLLILPSIPFNNTSEYAKEKTLYWFTLTFLSAIAPMFLIKTKSDLIMFTKCILSVCMIANINATITLLTQSDLQRLTALGSNTIALGRASGIMFIYIFICTLQRKIKYKYAVPLLCLMALLLFSSGSKGPILFTATTVFVVFAGFKWKNKAIQATAVIACFIVLIIFIWLNIDLIPQTSLLRVQEFFAGGIGRSTGGRIVAYKNSISEIATNPFGVGFGNSEKVINKNMKYDLWLVYPHNTILEAFLECGWLYGLFFLFVLGLSVANAYKISSKDKDYIFIYSLFVFLIQNAMVSGEMNDRILLALLGLSLSYKPKLLNEHEDTIMT